MKAFLKKIAVILAVLAVGFLILFRTPFIYNQTATYPKWVSRFMRNQANENRDEIGLIFYDDDEALRDDYVRRLDSGLQDLIRYAEKAAGRTAPPEIKLAWREDRALYITNPELYGNVSSGDFAYNWKVGIQKIRGEFEMPLADKAFFTFALSYFDSLTVINTPPESRDKTTDVVISLFYGDDRDILKGKIKGKKSK